MQAAILAYVQRLFYVVVGGLKPLLPARGAANLLSSYGEIQTKHIIATFHHCPVREAMKNEGREIRTPNLLIWSQTRCRCAIPPMLLAANWKSHDWEYFMARSCEAIHL